jgi:heterotetrameric sarcosine oxidase gamma subunit
VLDWFEEWLQTEWPSLRVRLTSVTEQWATIAVVGPLSRRVVAALAPDAVDLEFMTFRDTTLVNGVPARIARISFSGELAFEINVATWYGLAVWEAVYAAGAPHGITPYGTETMHVLRAEKGYPIVGQDTDGTVTPIDLGMEWIVSKRKQFVGSRSLRRPDTARPDRKQLVGLLPVDPADLLPEGAQLVAADAPLEPPVPMLGHVTSSYRSAALGRTFALALVKSGRDRLGQVLHAPLPDRTIAATVVEPVLYDPEGTRRDGPPPLASPTPSPRGSGALDSRVAPLAGRSGVHEIPFLTMINVRTSAGSLLGVPVPAPNRVATVGERAILWLGPDEYLVVGPPGDDIDLTGDSVVDVSANRTTIVLSGPHARDILAKGMSIDLHPRAFGPGHCAQTLLARAQVIVRQVDHEPTYHVLVRGSFATYLADWLVDAAKEFL